MTTLKNITSDIKSFEAELAPGFETSLWSDYCEDYLQRVGSLPYSEHDDSVEADEDFVAYWTARYQAELYATAAKSSESIDDLCDALNSLEKTLRENGWVGDLPSLDDLIDTTSLPTFGTCDDCPTGVYSYSDTSLLIPTGNYLGDAWAVVSRNDDDC